MQAEESRYCFYSTNEFMSEAKPVLNILMVSNTDDYIDSNALEGRINMNITAGTSFVWTRTVGAAVRAIGIG